MRSDYGAGDGGFMRAAATSVGAQPYWLPEPPKEK